MQSTGYLDKNDAKHPQSTPKCSPDVGLEGRDKFLNLIFDHLKVLPPPPRIETSHRDLDFRFDHLKVHPTTFPNGNFSWRTLTLQNLHCVPEGYLVLLTSTFK